MSHRHAASIASTSSSSIPILINPTPSTQARETRSVYQPILKYPYPLHLLTLLDIAYTAHHVYYHITPTFFKVLLVLRILIVGLLVGCSRKWRSRGGLVALTSCLTIGSCVWEGCAGRLYRGRGRGKDQSAEVYSMGDTHTSYLVLTSCIAIAEFLIYLLCLRLSPPSHRIHPLSIRNPASTVQSPTAFSFSFDPDHNDMDVNDNDRQFFTTSSTPRRNRRLSHIQPRRISRGDVFTDPSAQNEDIGNEEDQLGFTDGEDDDDEGFEDDSASSISESSIIDLPPPLSPSRIHPPTSLSIPRALDLAALDGSPVLGPLVRRTRSARLLVGSFGRRGDLSRGGDGGEGRARAVSAVAGPSGGEGYGTFMN